MSIWKLSPGAEQDVQDLWKRVRRPSRLTGSRKTVELIERLAKRNEPAAIPAVASGLFSPTCAVHDAASAALKTLLELVPSLELIRLNELLGGYYFGYVSERWNEIQPKQVESFLSKPSDIPVGNLLSFHKNGYVRHVAIRFLSGVESGEELRFLLIRQNDWVNSISENAQAMVGNRLTADYLQHFASETDLLFHLLQCKRRDLSASISKYVDLIIQPKHRSYFQQAIDSCNKKAGRAFVGYLLNRDGDHLADTVRAGVASSDRVIRSKSLRRAADCLTNDECNDIAEKLLSDKFIPVRQEAYELKAKLSPASNADVWQRCLFDKNRALRETAMFYLRKSNCDVAAIYRENLSSAPNSLPALSGLVASGDVTDLDVFSSYLNFPFASRRAEAVRGIGRVGSETDVLGLQQFLLDESSRVARVAHQQLRPIVKSIDSEFLFGLLEKCKTLAGQNAILRLLIDKGRWSAMSYLVRAAASPDQSLAQCSKALLNYNLSLNRVFTQPSTEQRNRIQIAIHESQASFDEEFSRDLSSYLASFGFKSSV